ncbi:ligand-dependent nuclear receptor-interacting factor 1-like [Mixophyes fleayi]|uniref:ligand-dependent nuclear receptor-interacting factor 1-like n=1 Tax=Mixophyes fleayi TaxID=3061075 RepID=UPI003F4D787E
MSDHQHFVVTQPVPPNTCLTGCLYQVVQATGLEGSNVLKLIPILKSKDNLTPVVPSPVIPGVSALNVPQAVRFSAPSSVPNLSLPCPVSVPLLRQPGVGNYIIATQRDLANTPKTIRIENTFSTNQDFPTNSPSGKPTFIMMNTKSTPIPVRPTQMLPTGHRLQIPAHAEVKSVPASSLPLSIQQKILPQTSYNDITKSPSVIYVSPVNTVKTLGNQVIPLCPKPNISNMTPMTKSLPFVPTPSQTPLTSRMDSPKGPMKWIVQENKESAACLVPVSSSNDTASKILQMLSGTKTEEINLTSSDSSKVMQIKDNALVMCNNKIFFLTKRGTELIDPDTKKQESPLYASPDKSATEAEQIKDLSNKVVEVVLSKNKSSPPTGNQPSSPANETSTHPNVCSAVKSNRTSISLPTNRNDPSVSYIDKVARSGVTVKPQVNEYGPPSTASSTKVNSADKVRPEYGSVKKNEQVSAAAKATPIMTAANLSAASMMDDRSWRLKFGLVKKEKIILKRIPLLQADNTGNSRGRLGAAGRIVEDSVETQQHQMKRKSTSTETKHSKRMSVDGTSLNSITSPLLQTSPPDGGMEATSLQRRISTAPVRSYYSTETSTSHSDHVDFHLGQDITGHFSEVSLPSQRFHFEPLSSVYVDETTKDEKIQRLKEVLKEREQALEALRRPKKI